MPKISLKEVVSLKKYKFGEGKYRYAGVLESGRQIFLSEANYLKLKDKGLKSSSVSGKMKRKSRGSQTKRKSSCKRLMKRCIKVGVEGACPKRKASRKARKAGKKKSVSLKKVASLLKALSQPKRKRKAGGRRKKQE